MQRHCAPRRCAPAAAPSGAAKRPRKAEEAAAKAAEEAEEEEEEEGEESEEEEGEESEEEIQLQVDQHGRAAVPGDGPEPQYGFRSFPAFVQTLLGEPAEATKGKWLEALQSEAEAAFTAREARKGETYSAGETFWVGAGVKEPATLLEKFALAIFMMHTGDCPYEAETSGAEWWTQVIDAEDDIGWHWDRDYTLEADAGFRLHPHLASVTYLADLGAPTVILEAIEDPPEGCGYRKRLDVGAMHWSRPAVGKHISFDGRWLHGAPADLAKPAGSGGAGKRFTFLVNMWLNHRPRSTVPYAPPGGHSSQQLPASRGTPKEESPVATAQAEDFKWAHGADEFTWEFGAGADDDEEGEEEAKEKGDGAAGEEAGAKWRRKVFMKLPLQEVGEACGKGGALPGSFTVRLTPGLATVALEP